MFKIIMTLLIFNSSVIPNIYAQSLKPFSDTVVLVTKDCKSLVVDLGDGKLNSFNSEQVVHVCMKLKEVSLSCSMKDSAGKIYPSTVANGGLIGSDGVIMAEGEFEFLLSSVTRKFYSNERSKLLDGKKRITKVCVGDWFYAEEIKDKK